MSIQFKYFGSIRSKDTWLVMLLVNKEYCYILLYMCAQHKLDLLYCVLNNLMFEDIKLLLVLPPEYFKT